ncbi:MAG TPA: hypothetical protein PLH72_07670 [Vicinamibacterales bacterium]|nr:hypothetical protein [Vicinamibacterales bacterium]
MTVLVADKFEQSGLDGRPVEATLAAIRESNEDVLDLQVVALK